METREDPVFLPEYARINILNDAQVQFWTRHLNVSEKQLRNAVFIKGPVVKEVKEYLARQNKNGKGK